MPRPSRHYPSQSRCCQVGCSVRIPAFMKARTTPKAGILAHASTIHWQEFSFFKNRFGFDPFTHYRKFLYFLPFRCTQCKVLEHIIYIAAVFGFAREAKKRQDMIGPCVITSRFPSQLVWSLNLQLILLKAAFVSLLCIRSSETIDCNSRFAGVFRPFSYMLLKDRTVIPQRYSISISLFGNR